MVLSLTLVGIAVFENLTIAASSLVLAIPGSLGAAYIVQAARVGRFLAVIQQAARNQGILLATDSDALHFGNPNSPQ